MLMPIDYVRLAASAKLDLKKKAQLGQYFTPSSIARFMAALFPGNSLKTARLLDAGAGVGSLTTAFLDRYESGEFGFEHVDATVYEIDVTLREHLTRSLAEYASRLSVSTEVLGDDFIECALNRLQFGARVRFTHAILNPPYKKIGSDSRHRRLLRQAGIETVNLYSAFVALAISLMAPGGQIVAIIPRSFCNGPYYRPFREFVLKRAALRHLHLFASRNQAFKDDNVLQENIIVRMECGAAPGDITVSTSTDDRFDDYQENVYPFDRIVLPDDPERFIHIPTSVDPGTLELSHAFRYSLSDIGVEVSTGPVVDFRLKHHLRDMPESGAVPLLYPAHFVGSTVEWPALGIKKPNALMLNAETEKWLYPNGFYTVVRRFSSKEEKRRIVASVVSPDTFASPLLGFENHLNVFHHAKRGLPEALVHGISVYLNSSAVDHHFRRFSGHTQVNATDLRLIKYPSRDVLMTLGLWATKSPPMTQEQIDAMIESIR